MTITAKVHMMKRRNSVPKGYMDTLARLYGKPAQQAPKQPLQRTQTHGVLLPYHPQVKTPCEPYSSGTVNAIYLQEICPMNLIHDDEETAG